MLRKKINSTHEITNWCDADLGIFTITSNLPVMIGCLQSTYTYLRQL